MLRELIQIGACPFPDCTHGNLNRFKLVAYSFSRRQTEGSSEQVIKLFSTIRGSGWY